ncbi:endonuclease NucS domain-containing protein [Micromonospora sp. NPDC050417]|uniref:endonuclease NucS domain-containing protein n=1 Tax=Micromonospora sp. NPDC050417 TaxID=3364280 RepID=UPI003796BDE0
MSGKVHENAVRDALASRLALIEPGLRCVATEYRLPSRVGAGGRIDILARDSTGSFVIIELKRTEAAAEVALHELHKYVELFRREKGIGPADVRVVLAAVEWRGLHAAFSQAAREWSMDLRGYRLTLKDDGVTPIAADRVQPLAEATVRELTPIQLLVQTRTGNLDAIWRWALRELQAAGVRHMVGFEVAHPTYDPGIYLVLGRMSPLVSDMASGNEDGCGTVDNGEWEEEVFDVSDAPPGYEAEHRAQGWLCRSFNSFQIELGHPHVLAQLAADPDWTIRAVRRTGVYTDEVLYPDDEVLFDAQCGGLSDVKYSGSARVDHPARWQRLLDRLNRALAGNADWARIVHAWCRELTAAEDSVELTCHIYNPCDLPAAVAFGWPSRWLEFVPMGLCVARAAGKPARTLQCVLAWNGLGIDVPSAFECAYQDPMKWIIARNGGVAWETDLEFLRLLGLRYVVLETIEGERLPRQVDWDDDDWLVRREPDRVDGAGVAWSGVLPLAKWVHDNRRGLDLLATWLRSEAGISMPTGTLERAPRG